ncbi:MAG TPA: hypothetical protein VIY29_21565 [Ktedonobacteraceae bacterium]
MSSRMLYRLSGGTLIAASLLSIVNTILGTVLYPGNTTPQQYMSLPWLLANLVIVIGMLLFVIGLPGMYLRQAGRAGVLGLVGFILAFFGSLLAGAFFTLQVTVFPLLAQVAPKLLEGELLPGGLFLLLLVFSLLDMIGAILLGIATMRAHVFPRWTGVLLIIAGIGMGLTFVFPPSTPLTPGAIIETVSSFAYDAAFLWCGYVLITGGRGTVEAAPLLMTEAQASR